MVDELRCIEQAIAPLRDGDDHLRGQRDLLASIPGLGERAIAVLLACGVSSAQFDTARQFVAFGGLRC